MADVVTGTEHIQVKIRLKVGFEVVFQIEVHLILIRVDAVCIRLVDSLYIFEESIRSQNIIMVQKGDKVAFCQFQCLIGIAGDSVVSIQCYKADTGIPSMVLFQNGGQAAIQRSICDAELPVGIGLILYRFNHLTQELLRGTESRYCQRDSGSTFECSLTLLLQFLLRYDNMSSHPDIIVNIISLESICDNCVIFLFGEVLLIPLIVGALHRISLGQHLPL